MSDAPKSEDEAQSSIGRFIKTYSSFLSSFVIGVAGLVATSTYQFSQSKLAQRQAEAQQRIAETQADNSWRIERAKILSQNLQVLTAQGGGNSEQRYGVLLSLTRGNILDPELAVSYALELGKDNPEYMRSVLASTRDKEYRRLAGAFQPTCEQRYGTARAVPACDSDKLAERSAALAELVSDETQAAMAAQQIGPLKLLGEPREVEASLSRLLWLFTPLLNDIYERRAFEELARFEAVSSGARLIAALAVLAVPSSDLATGAEAAQLEKLQAERRAWLKGYLLSAACEPECKGKIAVILLSGLTRARGDYDEALRAILSRPRAESVTALSRLGTRLRYCQVADDDAAALRDRILVPELREQLKAYKAGGTTEDLIGLLALLPAPVGADRQKEQGSYAAVVSALQKAGEGRLASLFAERQASRDRLVRNPPPSMRKANFCAAKSTDEEDTEESE